MELLVRHNCHLLIEFLNFRIYFPKNIFIYFDKILAVNRHFQPSLFFVELNIWAVIGNPRLVIWLLVVERYSFTSNK